MIVLPNGDKWIFVSEIKNIPWGEIELGNIPETSVEVFIERLLQFKDVPRKLADVGSNKWNNNFDLCKEVLEALSMNSIHTDAFDVYEMFDGKVHVIYQRADTDMGGYDMELAVITYPSRVEYTKAVCFED